MFRAVYLTFHGEFRGGEEAEGHLHESPPAMVWPLRILGVLSVVGGAIGVPALFTGRGEWNLIERFLEPVILPMGEHAAAGHGAAGVSHHAVSVGVEWLLVVLSLGVAVAGILLARSFYTGEGAMERPRRLAERFPLVHRLLLNTYYVDQIYEALVVRPVHRLATFCWKVLDVIVIDGVGVNGTAFATELSGDVLRFLQTGNVRNYALSVAAGVIALALILW